MAADEDADALLAQALWAAEQADLCELATFAGHGGGGDRSDDSDYDARASSKRRRRQPQPRKGRAKQPRRTAVGGPTASPPAGGGECAASPQRCDPTGACGATAGDMCAPAPAPLQQEASAVPPGAAQEQAQRASPALDPSGTAVQALPAQQLQQQQQQQQQQQEEGDGGADGLSAGGRRKRKDCGQKRERGKPWTPQEEEAFLAGLEEHGRDWKAIAAAIGTRDSRAVASHAQKHFIRLCMAGQPLPARVAESGRGYTLSGKLLDPASAAAQAYGFRQDLLARLEGEELATALAGLLPLGADEVQGRDQAGSQAAPAKRSKPAGSAGAPRQQRAAKAGGGAPAEPPAPEELLAAALDVPPPALAPMEEAGPSAQQHAALPICGERTTGGVQPEPGCTSPGPPSPQQAAAAAPQGAASAAAAATATATGAAAAPEPRGESEYAASRPRRGAAGQRLLRLGSTSESLELIACREFVGPVGGGGPAAQPYSVEVELQAMVLMEVHAHLSGAEVIGLLGGGWDATARRMRVAAAYPCRRAAGSGAATSVELDASAEVEARGAMAAAGQRCVGWYHSHPTFAPTPSVKDCDNQRNYQALTREQAGAKGEGGGGCGEGGGCGGGGAAVARLVPGGAGCPLEPFVGFILCPFDPALPRPHTGVTAFVVQGRGAGAQGPAGPVPYNMRYGLVGARSLPGPPARAALRALLASCRHDAWRTDLHSPWRCFTALCPTGGLLGPPLTKLDKLLAGLRWQCGHVGDRAAVEAWLHQLRRDIQEVWELADLPASGGGGGGGATAVSQEGEGVGEAQEAGDEQ